MKKYKNDRKPHIALVTPPLIGHKYRGTGEYTVRLFKALRELKKVDVFLANIDDPLVNCDIIHFPYFDPFFLTLPLNPPKATVVTVHDLIPLRFPEEFPKGIKGWLKWQIQKYSIQKKDAIITVSMASKKDIIRFTGINGDKITVIYSGVGEEFKKITDHKSLADAKRKLNLPDKYILYVGDINYNKNIPGLLKAFSIARNSSPDHHLVVAGQGFSTPSIQLNQIHHLIRSFNLGDKFKMIGHVSTEDLIVLYNLASVYVQPSFSEGFGLPVLEAMACGTPVVTSGKDGLGEIVGNCAVIVDPYDSQDMAEGILSILQKRINLANNIKESQVQAAKFSWGKTALATYNVYQQIINQ